MLKRIDDNNDNGPFVPSHYQAAFAIISLDTILGWAWTMSEAEFCEKMRQETGWQSTQLGFAHLQPVRKNPCFLSRHITFTTRTEWLWIAGRCKGTLGTDGSFRLSLGEGVMGISPEEVAKLDQKAVSGEFDFIRVRDPEPSSRDQTIAAQLMTQGGFFVPTEYMAQERLQYALWQDPHALLLTPEGPDILKAAKDHELNIYSMSVTDEWVEVRLEGVEEDVSMEPYQVYWAVHMRGQDVNGF